MVYQKNVLSIDKITVSSQIRGSTCSGIDPMGVNMLRKKVWCLINKGVNIRRNGRCFLLYFTAWWRGSA